MEIREAPHRLVASSSGPLLPPPRLPVHRSTCSPVSLSPCPPCLASGRPPMPPTKRKRTPSISACLPATAGIAPPPPMDAVQPSSRDASDEGAEDVVLQAVAHKKERQADGSSVVKRARVAPPAGDGQAGSDSDSDAELGGRASKKSRRTASLEHGENGEAGTLRMEPPPKAGLVDPVGYKTNPPPQDRAVRIYADGVFDLFHIGHMRALQQAKMAFDRVHLIVGVTGNKETHKRKGLTVLSAVERAESVRHCKWVDEVIEDCPWIVTADFLLKHHIDYVAHDDLPYGADEGDDIYGPIKEKGMFLVTQRTEGLSTTGIITKYGYLLPPVSPWHHLADQAQNRTRLRPVH